MRTLGNRLRFILQTGLHRGRDRGQIYNKEAFVQEVAANIIRTVSNLMSENKSMAWLDLKVPLRMKLINHLLLALEEVAFMLAEVTETPEFLEEVAENLGECQSFSVSGDCWIPNSEIFTWNPTVLQNWEKSGLFWRIFQIPLFMRQNKILQFFLEKMQYLLFLKPNLYYEL